jgi:dipeptidyl-peptidase-4
MLALLLPQLLIAQGKKQITLDDLYKSNSFAMKSVSGFNGMKDGQHYTKIVTSGKTQYIVKYSFENPADSQVLFDNSKTLYNGKTVSVDDYSFSKDEQKMLLKTEGENIYRRSVKYVVYTYDLKTGNIQLVNSTKILHSTFSPDASQIAYVANNNLLLVSPDAGVSDPISTDGEWNKIINGNCDWVYEEEFGFSKAYDWSPDGNYIAYYRFDESKVHEYSMPMYDELYPKNYSYKYPKAGEDNSIVEIYIYDVKNKKSVKANAGTETDQYIPRIKWTKDNNTLCIYRMNRLQNKLELLFANATTGVSEVVYTETNPYYVDVDDNMTFLPDNSSFIFDSEQDGFNHLYRYDWKKKKLTCLTPGNYDVAGITGIDEEAKQLYYTAAEKTPLERKLYAIGWDGKGKKTLTPEDGTHNITTVTGSKYFLDKHSSLTVPPVYYLRNASGKIIRTLEDNHGLVEKMKEYDLGKLELKQIKISENNTFNAWMITPPNFDPNKKYPVLMYQYSGPGSQEVADRFPLGNYFWHQMLAQKGYIIFCADGTGTGFRGQEFKKKTYLQLGKLESNDQISFAKYLAEQPYVDKGRIGIWGWSYGGFMSSTCLFKGNDVFKAAIAVAPVTNWRYYDNIYTERYMRTPKENETGYDSNAPEKMADKLNGKLLLIHGTADDNVHFQNSTMLVNALIKANKDFDSEYYPNRNHGISGNNARPHLYKRMTEFILNNL